jgi:superfamily II DNA or RNA helicase
MDSDFVDVVKKLVSDKGIDILSEVSTCRGLLADYAHGDFSHERQLLLKVVNAGTPKKIATASESDLKLCKINQLAQLHGMWRIPKEDAADMINLLSFVLCGDTTQVSCDDMDAISQEKDDISLGDHEYKNYYINVKMIKQQGCIYIPCGIGEKDYGYYICGIVERARCEHEYANIYALVYNYIIRYARMTDADKPTYLKNVHTVYQLDYRNIFRLETIILQLIKNNYITDSSVSIHYDGDPDEVKYAIEIINNYAELFCRLAGVAYDPLKQNNNRRKIVITLSGQHDIYVKDNRGQPCNAREIWCGQKINYKLDRSNLPDLEYLLKEISQYDSFKEGQFDALKDMLAVDGHSICIMPTGSGKSLIFYMVALLQPSSVFVIAPTELLIRDQIRNLKETHRFDNVSHLRLTADNDFSNFEILTNLTYFTPETFQSVWLFKKFRGIKENLQVAYVVLDEIHCLSNWGHDFRPEYLMLAQNLNKYLGRSTFLGFTATANYTVVEDVIKQLSMDQKNIFSPIPCKKHNIQYDFRKTPNTEKMYSEVCSICQELIKSGDRTIIFTKNEGISNVLAKMIGDEADVLKNDGVEAYRLFAAEKSKVLIASNELGIGVNLPNVKNIIHVGLPVSKSDYVQEIGRAGRANEKVVSYIIYLDDNTDNVPSQFFDRNSDMRNCSDYFKNNDNDYHDIFINLNDNIGSPTYLADQLLRLKDDLENWGGYGKDHPEKNAKPLKKRLFMLYVMGYVDSWYAWSTNESNRTIKIIAPPYRGEQLIHMKKCALGYFDFLGDNRKQIHKIQQACSIEEIIHIYADWYYFTFLYKHREMFLDFMDFIKNNAECDSNKINNEIKYYFQLPFIKIKSVEEKFSTLNHTEIADAVVRGIGHDEMADIERFTENQYTYSLEFLLLLMKMKTDNYFDQSRFDRIILKTSKNDYMEMLRAVAKAYCLCTDETKFEILKNIEPRLPKCGSSFDQFVDLCYASGKKDLLYYGMLAVKANLTYEILSKGN